MEVDCSSASNWIIYINKRDKPQRRRHICPYRPRSAPYSGLELSLPQSALCARKDGSKHYANEAASRPIGGLQAARPSVAAIYRRGRLQHRICPASDCGNSAGPALPPLADSPRLQFPVCNSPSQVAGHVLLPVKSEIAHRTVLNPWDSVSLNGDLVYLSTPPPPLPTSQPAIRPHQPDEYLPADVPFPCCTSVLKDQAPVAPHHHDPRCQPVRIVEYSDRARHQSLIHGDFDTSYGALAKIAETFALWLILSVPGGALAWPIAALSREPVQGGPAQTSPDTRLRLLMVEPVRAFLRSSLHESRHASNSLTPRFRWYALICFDTQETLLKRLYCHGNGDEGHGHCWVTIQTPRIAKKCPAQLGPPSSPAFLVGVPRPEPERIGQGQPQRTDSVFPH